MNHVRSLLIRVLLWCMLILSTAGSIHLLTSPPEPKPRNPSLRESTVLQDQAVAGFAAAFARAWLTWPVSETPDAWESQLRPFVPSSLLNSNFPQPVAQGKTSQQVEAVFPIQVTRQGAKQFLVSVYAETNLHPLVDLIVPVYLNASAHPIIVNPPMMKPVSSPHGDAPRQTASPAPDAIATALRPTVVSFLEAYVSGQTASDLDNFLAPGFSIHPLGGLFTWRSLTDLQVLGKGPYTVVATADVVDPIAKRELSQIYVLHMVQSDGKWFVSSLQP